MKRLILLLLVVLGAMGAEAQVRWERCSTDELRERAIAADKLVFIDLFASWCGPCQQMERQVFTKKEVGEFFDTHFVAAKFDVDRPTGRQLMQNYGRGSIPLYLIFDTEGVCLASILGAYPAEEFLEYLRQIVTRYNTTKKEAR